MPEKEHLPQLVRLFNASGQHRVVELRRELNKALDERNLRKKDCDYVIQMTALAYWLHRKKIRITTGDPYIVHPLEVAIHMAKDEFIPKNLLPRAIAGAVLHDTEENNTHVTHEKLAAVAGKAVANDVEVYSRKSANDIAVRWDTSLSEEEYLKRILQALPHVKRGKVRDRINNMSTMPEGAKKMYNKYFREDREAFIAIIRSLGINGQNLYRDYKKVHDANKPADVEELPTFEEMAA